MKHAVFLILGGLWLLCIAMILFFFKIAKRGEGNNEG